MRKMLFWRERCLRVASRLIATHGSFHSLQLREQASTHTYSFFSRNGSRNGNIIQAQYLHQRAGLGFQKHFLKRKSLRPTLSPTYRKPSSKLTPLSTITYATLSISGIFLLYVTSSTNPHLLDSWNEPESRYPTEVSELGDVMLKYKPEYTAGIREADAILAWDAESNLMRAGGNVLRYDAVRIPSNPANGEDRTTLVRGLAGDELEWMMPCIFDGHAGSRTVTAILNYLPHYIVRHMVDISTQKDMIEADPSALDKAIKEAFIELDQDIMDEAALALEGSAASAIPALEAAYAGSCAILSYYDVNRRMLKTACTGDSRAVLGRFSKTTGEWEAIALSKDQTGHNESEVLRLQREHPNEPEMIKGGRLLGLAVTRAFGDSRWKWPQKMQELARDRFFGPQIREGLLTPPYLTAEPEITTTEIQPENGDFIIQASDGLWDELTNAQAVTLIGRWLQRYDPSKGAAPFISQDDIAAMARLPDPETEFSSGQQVSYHDRVREEDWIVKDENAASHLARNALGGRNDSRLRGTFVY